MLGFWLGLSWISASQVVLVVKNLPATAGDVRDVGLIPGLGRSPGGGDGNPLQYSCLENPMDRGAWQATSIGSQRVGHYWSDLACIQELNLLFNLGENWQLHNDGCSNPWRWCISVSVQFCSVAESCLTLWGPTDCSTLGLPVHHQLPEFTQTHVHWVGDAILWIFVLVTFCYF